MSKIQKTYLLLGLVILIAVFFRFWQIHKIPLGLYPDEAINANDALTNPGKVFYVENNGREGLFINLLFVFFSLFGTSITVLRVVPAFFGTLTVLGIFLLAKELFFKHPKRDFIALLSALFVAVSFWHTNFSRIGFRAILLPFFLVFAFYFLLRALRFSYQEQRIKFLPALLGGLFYGLGFYTYIPFRLSPLIFLAFVFPLLDKNLRLYLIKISVIFVVTAFLVALPIGIYFLEHPQDFMSRAGGVSVFSTPNPIKNFFQSFLIHLGMFVWRGDQNWRHSHPQKTVTLRFLGILFYFALIFAFWKLIKALRKKSWDEVFIFSFLLFWFFVLLLGGVLTYEGIPHSLRTIGVIPPVYILIAWIISELFLCFEKQKKTKLGWALLILIVVYAVLGNFYWYFIKWAKDPNMPGAFTYQFVKTGEYLNSLPENIKKYVIVNEPGVPVPYPDGIPMPAQTVMFMERSQYHKLRATYLKPEELNKIKPNSIVILMKNDENILGELKTIFPKGQINIQNSIVTFSTLNSL